MELKAKDVRTIMLAIEKLSSVDRNSVPKRISMDNLLFLPELNHLNKDNLVYILRKLQEANYIIGEFKYSGGGLYLATVSELTFSGHQFLDTIRNNQIFDKVMEKLDEFGSGVTLEVIKLLATKLLKEKLGVLI